jgi:hypothetical protein
MAIVCLKINKSDPKKVVQFINMQSMIAFMLARNSLHTSAVAAFTRTCWSVPKPPAADASLSRGQRGGLHRLLRRGSFTATHRLVYRRIVHCGYRIHPCVRYRSLVVYALAAHPTKPNPHRRVRGRFQERSQKTYKARDAFLALVLFELPMGFIFGVMSYLVMWAPVGWDYKVIHCASPLHSAADRRPL